MNSLVVIFSDQFYLLLQCFDLEIRKSANLLGKYKVKTRLEIPTTYVILNA